MRSLPRLALPAVLASAFSLVALAQSDLPVTYSARVINFEQPQGRAPGLLQVRVTRWSSDADRDRLIDALSTEGHKAFFAELSKFPVAGVIRTPDTAGYQFRYARRVQTDSGNELTFLVDRPLEFQEFRQGWQTVDYPFTVVQFTLDDQGHGEGRLLTAARATKSKTSEIAFEAYSANPYLLKNVYREK